MECRVSAHVPVMSLEKAEIGISSLRRQRLSPDQPETLELRKDDSYRFCKSKLARHLSNMSSPCFSLNPLQNNSIGNFCCHIKGQGDVSLLGEPHTSVSYRTDQQARVDKPVQQQAQSQRHRTVVQVEPQLQVWVINSTAVKDFTLNCVHSSNFTFAPPCHQKPQPRVKKQIYANTLACYYIFGKII